MALNPASNSPIDYRELWGQLASELSLMANDLARRAITEKDLAQIPRHQGAFSQLQLVKARMDELLRSRRSENGE